jgi:hypothetical protein
MDCLHVLSLGHVYDADFKFDSRLQTVTNHTREGYAIGIGFIVVGMGFIVVGIGFIVVGIGFIVVGIGFIVVGTLVQ